MVLEKVTRVVAREVLQDSFAKSVSYVPRSGNSDSESAIRESRCQSLVEETSDCVPLDASGMKWQVEEDLFVFCVVFHSGMVGHYCVLLSVLKTINCF